MKPFLTDKSFQDKVNKFCKTLFSGRKFVMPKELLQNLQKQDLHEQYFKNTAVTHERASQYVQAIIDNYENLLQANNSAMADFIRHFNTIIPECRITTSFYEAIVEAMRYKDLREKEYLRFLKEMNIRNCVYCHAQFVITIDITTYDKDDGTHKKGDVKSIKGMLDLDHRHPKSKYPFLCTSFYNLYPTCPHCNRSKSDSDKSWFNFYAERGHDEFFKFKLKDYDIIRKQLGLIATTDIEIEIECLDQSDEQEKREFIELFNIKKIYNTQKDVIEELLWKKEIYTPEYIAELKSSFSELLSDPDMVNRAILGNYYKPEDVWKRPLAKFMQDIARDIKLIP